MGINYLHAHNAQMLCTFRRKKIINSVEICTYECANLYYEMNARKESMKLNKCNEVGFYGT